MPEPASGEASIVIDAPPNDVWALVADVTRMGEWSPENKGAEWLDGANGPAVGARFKGRNQRGKSRWSTKCEITSSRPGEELAFAVGGSDKPSTTWRYVFTEEGSGTRVTESFVIYSGLGFFSRLLTRVTTGVADRRADLEEGARQTLAALKEAAERPPA